MGTLKIGTAVLALATAALLAACGSSSAPASSDASTASLAGTAWVLTSFADGSGEPTAPVATPKSTLVLTDTDVSGSTGCNRFTGTYSQGGTKLTVTVGGVTQMACPGAVGEQETAVLANLGKVATATQDGTTLALADSSGAVLLAYEQGATSLEGTSWQATGINDGKSAVVSTADTATVTAAFSNGTVSGNGGCNSYGAPFTTEGTDGIKLGPVASTQLACDLLDLEQQYFAALEKVVTYQIEGDTLTLRDADGATQVTFTTA